MSFLLICYGCKFAKLLKMYTCLYRKNTKKHACTIKSTTSKVWFFIHCTSFSSHYNFPSVYKNIINLVFLESWVECYYGKYFRENRIKIEKMKMKIFNFLFKIATECIFWTQKLQTFLIMKIHFLFWFIKNF